MTNIFQNWHRRNKRLSGGFAVAMFVRQLAFREPGQHNADVVAQVLALLGQAHRACDRRGGGISSRLPWLMVPRVGGSADAVS